MGTLVLNRASVSVNLEGRHLVLHDHEDAGDGIRRVPLVDVDRVVVVGQPAISFPVIARLLDESIPCSFLTRGGRWRGQMDGDLGFHAGRRKRQYDNMVDETFCLRLMTRLIGSKLANARRTLIRLATNRNISLDETPEWRGLSLGLKEVDFAPTMDVLRGIEGNAASCYFRLLSRFFPLDAPFEQRTRRPPRDAANALLSFVYALLTNEFVSAVRAHGLDVAAGCFHRGHDRSPALALDLMEPYRPGFADRLVVDLLNHRRIQASRHFQDLAEEGVLLTEEGRSIVFKAFDAALARRQETSSGSISLRQQIDRDVCSFIALLEHGETPQFYRAA